MRLTFSREFVAVTLQFARHVARITLIPLEDALFRFTPLYLSLGLPRDFDARHPVWQAFVAGLTAHRELVDWTHTFYLQQQAAPPAIVDPDPASGCFYYSLWPENRVRIHFRAAETASQSPLSRARHPQRLASWPPCSVTS
jgi:hypothetical protein